MRNGPSKAVGGKPILVTGGAGFIGSHLVDALVGLGAKVFVVDNLQSGRSEHVNPSASLCVLDVESDEFDRLLDDVRPAIVYHLAHCHFTPKNVEEPLRDLPALAGMLRILGRARRLGIERIVFASSGFVYGNNPRVPLGEDEPIEPVSPYAASKVAIEKYLETFHRLFGIPYAVLRYPSVYGPRQVTGAMADYIRKLSAGTQAEIYGDGSKTRDYVFVSDVVNANLLALEVPDDTPSPVFNISTGIETTLNRLYRTIATLVGREAAPRYLADRPGDQVRNCLHNDKARRIMGWAPRVTLEEGLRFTIEALGARLTTAAEAPAGSTPEMGR